MRDMKLLEILARDVEPGSWPFLVELERGRGRPTVRDLLRRPVVPLARPDGAFGDVIVGRGETAHVSLDTGTITTYHAAFRPLLDGTWQIIDRDSTSGTVVNGARLEAGVPCLLVEGSIIRLGTRKFAFGGPKLRAALARLVAPKPAKRTRVIERRSLAG
jgi:pSer/pThr/pTyr-binding forkhead associated (FHA) protein